VAAPVKKQGNTTFVAGFDSIFSGSGWGEVKPLVFEEPPKKVVEEPKVEEPTKPAEEPKSDINKEEQPSPKTESNGKPVE
jgi:hypothetical protein